MRGGIDHYIFLFFEGFSRNMVHYTDPIDNVSKELDPNYFFTVNWDYFHRVTSDPESTSLLLVIVALVLQSDEFMEKVVAFEMTVSRVNGRAMSS